MVDELDEVRRIAGAVVDPELPMLTVADLGVLREVEFDAAGRVVVSITPTYSGCPAMEAIRRDIAVALERGGYTDAEVRVRLSPPWTTDWLTATARHALAAAGIAPPGPATGSGPVPLTLRSPAPRVRCPQCGSLDTIEVSRFGATACRALWRCRTCYEPFERVKEI